ncbi:TonB-dependent receptor domain-containing protein [Pseudoteredinibacter isoporae]|uniref:Vitamin B12 transporter n=1 Tax=Pseudoteredinibacter isoporae TaxID=570281 RepID=A0A7X0JQ39_9GAMM|nr:vitamin B12 transporter [Pseudoteredinibacter isoporae]NHO85360.1 TonB-dependent receptor [Pseudoteredinibacter isoporae]NIB26188.1 TonB-dependent receptor [Pseudoteredinibacter isoporae]
MNNSNHLTAKSLLAVAIGLSVNATAESKIEEIVVVGNRIEMPLKQQSAAISIITAEQIERRGHASLMDVLRNEPAINVSNAGGPGKVSALRIRGEEGYRTKVYIDGIDVADPTGTQIGPQIQQINSAGIQRVEILRGAQGLVYGADAGGVVRISSQPQREGLHGGLSTEAGRYSTQNWAANISYKEEAGDISAAISRQDTDGFNARTVDSSGELDGYENTTAHVHAGLNFGDGWRVAATLRDVDSRAGYDGFSATSNHVNFSDYEQRSGRVAVSKKSDDWQHEVAYSNSETERENIATFGSKAKGDIETWQYLGAWDNKAHTLVFGAERETQTDQLNNNERDQDSAYVDWQWQAQEQLFLNAGIRHDDNEDFGKHNSYRLGAAYFIPTALGELKLKTTWGTGFRAPSLSELAYNRRPFAPDSILAVNLKEENTRSFDIGAQLFLAGGGQLELVYFDQEVENEIFFDLQSFSGYLQENGDSNSKGVELSYRQNLSENVEVYSNATYNDTQTVPNSNGQREQRLRRPRVLFNLGGSYEFVEARIELSANLRHVSGQRDISVDIEDYQVLDASVRWSATEQLDVYLRIENALDENYQEIPTYYTSGSAAYAGVKLSF